MRQGAPRRGDAGVFPAHVHAIGAALACELDGVVHDEDRSGRAAKSREACRLLARERVAGALGAVLDDRGTAGQALRDAPGKQFGVV